MKRPSESARSWMIVSPAFGHRRANRSAAGRGRSACCSVPAIDLIGASELLSSCPITRTSRCQACRSSSRSARESSEITSSSLRPAALAESCARRISQRPEPPGKTCVHDAGPTARCSISLEPELRALRPRSSSAARRAAPRPARFTSRSRASSRTEHGDVDVGDDFLQQQRRLRAPRAAGRRASGRAS